ncbi:MAG: putative 4-hydroxybenzoate polyprenyltransferase [Ignavibacteriales bacterium]|nr:putative 4-hydroxybenzoate polyprenyltransferase [Ignavibacteriales bacterium]
MKTLLRFVKIEHSLFSLPLIFSGIFLSENSKEIFSFTFVTFILLAAISARLVAMSLNRIIDREIDKRNPRTAIRELPSGKLKLSSAWLLTIISAAIYFSVAFYVSQFCFLLSPIPLIIFTIYPYMKRFTPFAHFGVGFGLSMAPLGGWFAAKSFDGNFQFNSFSDLLPGMLITFFTILWGTGFDIIYSTLDEEFDKKENLFSFPSRFGKEKALQYSALLHFLSFIVLVALYFVSVKSLIALPFLLLSGFLLYLEQKKSGDVELAFFKINAVLGFVVFVMVLLKS